MAAEPKTAGERVKLLLEVGAAVLVLNTGLNALTEKPKSIDRTTVYEFWNDHYLPTARTDPERALSDLTTDGFKQLEAGEPTGYTKFWKRVESTPELTVSDELPGPPKNKFDVHWRFIYKNPGTPSSTVTIRVTMVCAKFFPRYVPFWDCAAADLRLHDDQAVKQ